MSVNQIGNSVFSALSNATSGKNSTQLTANNGVTDFRAQLEMIKQNPESVKSLPVFDTFNSLLDMTSGKSETKSIPQIADDLAENISYLEDTFGKFFDMMGLDTSTEVGFQLDGKGGVAVATNNGTSEKIGKMFSDNPQLVSRYAVAAARASLINAYETNPQFRAGFDYDPRQAIKDNINLLKDKLLNGQMIYQDKKLTPEFD